MNKKKQNIIMLVFVFLLLMVCSIFYLMDREVQDTYIDTSNESNSIDYLESVTVQEISDNKAYFVEDLPSYLPGRVGKNSVDLDSYKTSELKEGYKFKILRIYKQDNEGNTTSEYKFVRDVEKEKSDR